MLNDIPEKRVKGLQISSNVNRIKIRLEVTNISKLSGDPQAFSVFFCLTLPEPFSHTGTFFLKAWTRKTFVLTTSTFEQQGNI